MSRFVQPETRTLPISEGDTLVVRAALSNGEERALFARIRAHAEKAQASADAGMAIVLAYLLDWSLRDATGRPVHITDLPPNGVELVLESLTPETYTEIEAAIVEHDRVLRVARAEKKH